jgi:hypothetical protein
MAKQYGPHVINNRELLKKSYMIEFVGVNGEPEDVFTFSIPPKQEELVYPQRITKTNTFGGVHMDEYGNDAVKISLSGTTINQELRLIYTGKGSEKWLTGEEEAYYLRDLIQKHRALERLVGKENENRKIIIYDLSKSNGEAQGGDVIKNYWQAFPGEYKVLRSDDRPNTYKYTFEFTGVPLEEGENINTHGEPPELTEEKLDEMREILTGPEKIQTIEVDYEDTIRNPEGIELVPVNAPYVDTETGQWVIKDPDLETIIETGLFENLGITWEDQGTWLAKIEETGEIIDTGVKVKKGILDTIRGITDKIEGGLIAAINFIDGVNGKVNDVLDTINRVSNLVKIAGNVMSHAANTLTGMIDSAGNTITGFIDGATRVIEGANAIMSLPRTIQSKTLNIGLEIQNAVKRLVSATDDLVATCSDLFSPGSGGNTEEDIFSPGTPPGGSVSPGTPGEPGGSGETGGEGSGETGEPGTGEPGIGEPGTGEPGTTPGGQETEEPDLPISSFSAPGTYSVIPQEILDQYGMNNEEFIDTVMLQLERLENIANELAAAAKSADIPDVTVGNPDPETGEPQIILSYGHTDVTVKSTDSLESLAAEYFGDPERAIDIATYNGIASLNDVESGDVIRIPVTRRTQRMRNNRIYAEYGEIDNYGKDIKLTEDGRFVVSSSGDYELTDGPINLAQAILLRLKERVRKRIRLNAYGIRTNISDPTAGVAYIVSSIHLTVISDPRVASIESIRFRARGDQLHVDIIYSDINKATGKASGGV